MPRQNIIRRLRYLRHWKFANIFIAFMDVSVVGKYEETAILYIKQTFGS